VCVVDVGARALAPACARAVEPGMKVVTKNERVDAARRTLVELLMADHPTPCARQQDTRDCELEQRAAELGTRTGRYAPARTEPLPFAGWTPVDTSHANIAVDHAACIVCDRCVRACTDVVHNFVIGRAGKGNSTVITFDAGRPMGKSSCVSCGECMVSCPTGALTNKGFVEARGFVDPRARGRFGDARIEGTAVSAERLLSIPGPDGTTPLFDGISLKFLAKTLGDTGIGRNEGAVVERRLPPKTVICREGDFGSTAFYIVSGAVDVFIATPQSHVSTKPHGLRRMALKMQSLLTSTPEPGREPPKKQTISIDGTVDLDRAHPVVRRGPGELFGEMTCLSFYPRSATVRTVEETVVIEMLRPALEILRRSKSFRAHVEQVYKDRALDAHLRSMELFADVGPEVVEFLRPRVTLQQCEPGEIICRQGDEATAQEGFYLVRIGFVKVTQHLPGGDSVLAYRGRGDFFGEMALLYGQPRAATCSAVDHAEVVKIGADDFRELIRRFPGLKARLDTAAEHRRKTTEKDPSVQIGSRAVEEFVGQGLVEGQSVLVLDLDRCTRCDLCVQACATAHDGVTRLVREGLRFDNHLVATSCRQCRDPLCMVGCPVGSIRRKENLEIQIEDWCIGCGVCAENCPYGNINMHGFAVEEEDRDHPGRTKAVVRSKATACDLCHSLGEDREPSCVVACPHGAAKRVDPNVFFAGRLTTL
jgi:CRP-like cAMP-binding protein/Fe-S-cluster-containing hydrogenase component 2